MYQLLHPLSHLLSQNAIGEREPVATAAPTTEAVVIPIAPLTIITIPAKPTTTIDDNTNKKRNFNNDNNNFRNTSDCRLCLCIEHS